MITKLQTIIFPNFDMTAPETMYFRAPTGGVIIWRSKREVDIPARAGASSDTFFNGFSVGKWKQICDFDDLSLALTGRGRVLVRIGLHVLHARRELHEIEYVLSDTPTVIEIKAFAALKDGMLFFEVLALEDATLTGGHYFTRTPAPNDVTLGVVCTHFNRKEYVLPAIARITEQLLQDPEMDGRVSMVVVDNSQNITADEAGGALVLANRNLGGAGGFTCGLLHLKDNGFSHCLFMDDDASCEIESIRRTFRILQYARSPKLAIAGSMMLEAEPSRLHEAGAIVRKGNWYPLKSGLCLCEVSDLLQAEAKQEKIDYGAWWHFAFRIDQVQRLAFPFFVRGDDIFFGLTNDFDIATMNGIGAWAEDFAQKENSFLRYLSFRSMLVIAFVWSSPGAGRLLRLYRRHVRNHLYSYNYSSARAITMAMQDVMRGPHFWRQNVDLVEVRKQLAQQCPGEKMASVTTRSDHTAGRSPERRWHRLARRLTWNGFLMPEGMIRDKMTFDNKHFTGCAYRIYRYRRVLYTVPNGNLGYVGEHDKRRFWEERRLARRTARDFRRQFDQLRKEYRSALPSLTSETFWRNVFDEDEGL